MNHPYFILSDNQKQLKMKKDVFDKKQIIIKVLKETKLYYFMKNGDQVYKSSGRLKSKYYDDRRYRVYFDGE